MTTFQKQLSIIGLLFDLKKFLLINFFISINEL
jgi:hypothetical protein